MSGNKSFSYKNEESSNPVASTEAIVTRIRRHYYGWFDKGSYLNKLPLELAIPGAPQNSGLYEFFDDGIPGPVAIDMETFKLLTEQADENAIRDNPSPYLIEPVTSNLIDIGHLFYGLDSLIHNYQSISVAFSHFGVSVSNELTGYIADAFPCAAEARLYRNGLNFKLKEFYYPSSLDYDRLYDITAPEADILSDVDAFGIYNAYLFYIDQNNPLPGNLDPTLGNLFRTYYDPNAPDPFLSYKKRWFNFCKSYYNSNGQLIHQGFIDASGNWIAGSVSDWLGNNPHSSVQLIRRKAEVHAHFWYFTKVAPIDVALNLLFGHKSDSFYDQSLHLHGTRFEKSSDLNPKLQVFDPPTGVVTDPTEVDYYLEKFMTYVKTSYLNE